jgi:hypothetical protein
MVLEFSLLLQVVKTGQLLDCHVRLAGSHPGLTTSRRENGLRVAGQAVFKLTELTQERSSSHLPMAGGTVFWALPLT